MNCYTTTIFCVQIKGFTPPPSSQIFGRYLAHSNALNFHTIYHRRSYQMEFKIESLLKLEEIETDYKYATAFRGVNKFSIHYSEYCNHFLSDYSISNLKLNATWYQSSIATNINSTK